MAIAEVTVIPIGTGSTSLSEYVADMQRVLDVQHGITVQLTPMSTIIEGDIADVMRAIHALHESPFQAGAGRVSTAVKIDDRRDHPTSAQYKLDSVRQKLADGIGANTSVKPQ
ncbi:MTH1187 family thiamine-binding protein [Paenibacillus campi]|uniref:MTH1187 family thiamine-binding protein n=1 Tax=Paenibacillus campi TaxID=3106031 RepID=UPI002AFEED4B|nr:MTH1187 family thiamine-binding protein [Paenibacillus sp. SGZ-1009]